MKKIPGSVRSLTLALAVAAGSATADHVTDNLYYSLIVFGDSLSDNGNAGIFTSSDPNGNYPKQPAVSFLAEYFGVSAANSCSGLGPVFGGAIPCAPAAGSPEQQFTQVAGSVLANGPNWAVGGNRTADVLLDVVGPQRFRELFPQTTVADHNTLSTILPDSSRCGADGVCDPAAGESPYLSPAETLQAISAFNDPVALQALVDDPNNNITLTGVPFATGQGYLPQNPPSRDQLYFLNGGGNDILAGVMSGTISPASMERSATFLATAARELKRAGAQYVVVTNAPRIGGVPSINDAGGAAVSAGNTGTALFNKSLRQQINAVGNVLIMDMEGVLELVLDNPGSFGFANINQSATCYATGACANPDPVYSESGSAPDSDKLVFNDGVHPTLAGQRMLADYYYATLMAPVGFALLPDLAYQNTRQHQLNIDNHLISQRFRDPYTTLFMGAGVSNAEFGTAPAYNDNSVSWDGFFGVTFAQFDDIEWGLGMSYGGSEYEPRNIYLESRNLNLSAFARWDNGLFFVDGGVTYSDVNYDDVKRRIYLGDTFETTIKADTDGDALSLFARAGYDSAAQLPCQIGPFVSVEWTQVDVNAFNERVHPDLTYASENGALLDPLGLRVRHQDRDYQRYRGGFFYNAAEAAEWRWFGEVWLEHNRGDDRADVGIGINSIRSNSAYMAAYRSENEGFFQNGAGALVGLNVTDKLQISGNIIVRPSDTVGGLNLNYRF